MIVTSILRTNTRRFRIVFSLARLRNLFNYLSCFYLLTFSIFCPRSAARKSRCYSCMSPIYEAWWEEGPRYSQIYGRQSDVTTNCRDPDGSRVSAVRWTECDSSCLKLEETYYAAGQVTKGYIRACYSSLFAYGFNRSSLSANRMEYRDMCGNFTLGTLTIRLPIPVRNTYVYVCSCHGDLCNGAAHPNPQPSQAWVHVYTLTFLTMSSIFLRNCLAIW